MCILGDKITSDLIRLDLICIRTKFNSRSDCEWNEETMINNSLVGVIFSLLVGLYFLRNANANVMCTVNFSWEFVSWRAGCPETPWNWIKRRYQTWRKPTATPPPSAGPECTSMSLFHDLVLITANFTSSQIISYILHIQNKKCDCSAPFVFWEYDTAII